MVWEEKRWASKVLGKLYFNYGNSWRKSGKCLHILSNHIWVQFLFFPQTFVELIQKGQLGYTIMEYKHTLFSSMSEWVSEVAQLCPTLYDPMSYSLPGSSVHGIFQARILEWVAISFSRGSCRPRDPTQISHIAGRLFTIWATRESRFLFQHRWN